jgi:hypothetical protein
MLEILITALLTLAPSYLDEKTALTHVTAAQEAAAATGINTELLLAMGYAESRYNPYALSRIECRDGACRRVTGLWTSEKAPKEARPSWYCGIMQVGGHVSWARCRELMLDVRLNYMVAAQHVSDWQGSPYCKWRKPDDKLMCALSGYGGGNRAAQAGKSNYAYHVLGVWHHLQRLMKARVTS